MIKLHNVKKMTDTNYMNLYCADVENDKKRFNYYFASKRKHDNLAILKKRISADAVRVIPYFFDENKNLKIVLSKEYKYPVGQFLFTLTAGSIEENESEEDAVKRELLEEIGAVATEIKQQERVSYISAGLIDEAIIPFEVLIELTKKPSLEDSEVIDKIIVDFEELPAFLDDNEFDLQSRLMLRNFYYKTKLSQFL